jgi:hypothetical protein
VPRLTPFADEVVLYEAGPHWSAMVLPVGRFVTVLVVAVVVVVVARGAPLVVGYVLLLAVLAAAGYLAAKLAGLRARLLAVTDRRVVRCSGVLRRRTDELPLARIDDCTCVQSLLQRLVGVGTLQIQPSGSGEAREVRHVTGARQVQALIGRAIAEWHRPGPGPFSTGLTPAVPGRGAPGGPGGEAPESGPLSFAAVLRELREAVDQGLITEAEFEAKRAELLRRL